MALSVLATLGSKIGDVLIAEGVHLYGVGSQVQQLQIELERIKRVLEDADVQQSEQHRTRDWISELRDLAYEADDLIETHIFEIESQRRGRGVSIMKMFKRYGCILREGYIRHQLGSEIEILLTRIANFIDRFQGFGVRNMMEKEDGLISRRIQDLRRTYSHTKDESNPKIVGLDSDVDMLVSNLISEDQYPLVSIYGMGGLGKTTLAKRVYNHPELQRHFQGRAWICISQEWEARDILERVLGSISLDHKKEIIVHWKEEDLVRELSRVLENKKCILVLDDVWTSHCWECIKQAFPVRENGSKILLTTRNRDVAVHVNDKGFLHEPPFLTEAQSWELLKDIVFKGGDDQVITEMDKWEELGKKMIKHCGGLPLAVVVLGGILVRKYCLEDWNNVYHNIKTYLSKNQKIGQGDGTVQKILSLSYDDLPWRLKPCFLYLARYSEDVEIEPNRLYKIWIAEGLILPEDQIGEESMMDVAQRYMEELAERCMVRVKEQRLLPAGIRRFESCSLHDMMRDMSLRIAKKENFFQFITHARKNGSREAESSAFRRIFRLVSRLSYSDVSRYLAPKKELTKHLRSFLFLMTDGSGYHDTLPRSIRSQFKNFNMLRVLEIVGLHSLDMEDSEIPGKILQSILDLQKLLEAIAKLKHLRYLSFRQCLFNSLPPSIGNLECLETLDLDSDILLIPDVLWKLKQLRHLHLPDPAEVLQRFKLRLGGLSRLETLANFNTRYYVLKDLTKLRNLWALEAIVEYDIENLKEVISFISNANKLKQTSLTLRISSSDLYCSGNGSVVLKDVFSCRNLHYLEIHGPTGNLPRCETERHYYYSSGLIKVVLRNCEIEEDPMMTLEKLPNLQELYLQSNSFVGKEMACHGLGFPKLKSMALTSLQNLEIWKVEEGAMMSLSSLAISSCRKLKMIPEGLRFITVLQELNLSYMPTQFCQRITGIHGHQGEDSHKVCHVPSVFIKYKLP